jgi:hypothetical protein
MNRKDAKFNYNFMRAVSGYIHSQTKLVLTLNDKKIYC